MRVKGGAQLRNRKRPVSIILYPLLIYPLPFTLHPLPFNLYTLHFQVPMPRSSIYDILPPWSSRIRPYPPGKPIEEVERELGHTAIKLASNENPLGPSPKAQEAIRNYLNHIHFYPDGSGYYLRKKLAEIHGLPPEQIILGAGSTDLIELVAKTFLSGSADEAITSESAFYMYRLAIEDMGAGLVQTPMRDLTFDLAAIAHAITARTKVVYLGNPNNPTGTIFTAEELDRFLAAIPPRVLVVLDEAYFEYVQRPDYSHSVDCVRAGKNLLVLRTFSKVHGLAGIRLGYGMGHPELIECLQRIRSPFNASSLAQVAGMAALDDTEHVAKVGGEQPPGDEIFDRRVDARGSALHAFRRELPAGRYRPGLRRRLHPFAARRHHRAAHEALRFPHLSARDGGKTRGKRAVSGSAANACSEDSRRHTVDSRQGQVERGLSRSRGFSMTQCW